MNISNSLTLKAYTLKGQLPPQWKDRPITQKICLNSQCQGDGSIDNIIPKEIRQRKEMVKCSDIPDNIIK